MLSIQSISKSYKKQQVLQNVSFDAAPGECIGLLGPNGCGKSTLLHILSGTDTPDSGTILFDGKNLLKNPSLQSTKIGYVAQNNPLFPDMTAMDHLKLWYSFTTFRTILAAFHTSRLEKLPHILFTLYFYKKK